ncbi:MAG: lysine--tRNA ligase, partial [Chloroflexi bacterium]|nr:lysine--tRNA ligase [Chloroflexota bacterium]
MTPEEGASDDQLRQQRLDKLDRIRATGVDPWPAKVERSHNCAEARSLFEAEPEAQHSLSIAGRILALRDLGKMSFAQLQDGSGKLQLSLQVDDLGDRYEDLKQLDIGDFVAAAGYLWRTRRGEISLRVQKYELLAKSLRPLPEKWHGLQDQEKRYRQRYLDLITNEGVREVFLNRTKIVRGVREFLDSRGFVEVETPALQPLYGGAAARPFVTHHNALDRELFLRISDELYLKRLIIGGIDKVYELAKDFRNEGIDTRHNPEFSMLEVYEAYADVGDIMALTEALIRRLAADVLDGSHVAYGDHEIRFDDSFSRISVRDACKQRA